MLLNALISAIIIIQAVSCDVRELWLEEKIPLISTNKEPEIQFTSVDEKNSSNNFNKFVVKSARIKKEMFAQYPDLKKITIEVEEVGKIEAEDDAFDALTQLVSMKISGIVYFKKRFLKNLRNLETLSVSNTKFDVETAGYFENLDKLQELIISNVDLSAIFNRNSTYELLKGLNKLQVLVLKNNNIKHLDSHHFEYLANLEYLNINDNQISEIRGDEFGNLGNLYQLDLSRNKIARVNWDNFRFLMNLRFLIFDHNEISRIDVDEIGDALKQILVLQISKNAIPYEEIRRFAYEFDQKFPQIYVAYTD